MEDAQKFLVGFILSDIVTYSLVDTPCTDLLLTCFCFLISFVAVGLGLCLVRHADGTVYLGKLRHRVGNVSRTEDPILEPYMK